MASRLGAREHPPRHHTILVHHGRHEPPRRGRLGHHLAFTKSAHEPGCCDELWPGTVLNLDEWLSQEVSVPAAIGAPAPPLQRRDQLPLQTDIVTFP